MESNPASGADAQEPELASAQSPAWRRLEDQIAWYDARSTLNQRMFKALKVVQIEPPRVEWRLDGLRGSGHGKEVAVSARGARARHAHGVGAAARVHDVADAGIVLVATLAARLGIEALADRFVGLGRRAGDPRTRCGPSSRPPRFACG